MSVVEQLVDMGFDRARAEKAFSVSGGTLEAVMEYLIAHEGQDIGEGPATVAAAPAESSGTTPAEGEPSQTPSAEPAPSAGQAPEAAAAGGPGTFVCNDCNKLLRDHDAMVFHATKTGHENFAESNEEMRHLTPEEKAQQADELRKKIKESMARKAEQERKDKLEAEKRRREDGKKMLEFREKQQLDEMKILAEKRKQQKLDDQATKQRVLEEIRMDREARKAKDRGEPAPVEVAAPTPKFTPPPKVDYDQANIQIRLIDGSSVRNTFSANESLSAVRLWIELNHSNGVPFNLMTPFPRKVFSPEDYDTPLKHLGLVPSASIVMSPR